MNKQNLMLIIIAITAQVYYLLLLYGGTEKNSWSVSCKMLPNCFFFRK